MTSMTLTVTAREDGFFAYTLAVPFTPLGVAGSWVQVTVTDAGCESGASGAQTSPNDTVAWSLFLVMLHDTTASATADISLRSDCATISLTGSGTVLSPFGFTRYECSDEPLYRCEPSARRA